MSTPLVILASVVSLYLVGGIGLALVLRGDDWANKRPERWDMRDVAVVVFFGPIVLVVLGVAHLGPWLSAPRSRTTPSRR